MAASLGIFEVIPLCNVSFAQESILREQRASLALRLLR